MKTILVSGKSGSGKDAFARYLKEELDSRCLRSIMTHYADPVKYFAEKYFNWDGVKDEKGRHLLQTLGTDIIREKLGKEDLFIKRMIDDIEIFSCFYDAIIISDVRFPAEIEDIKLNFDNVYAIYVENQHDKSPLTLEEQ